MILRTPPLRNRRAESPIIESPVSDRRLVVYNDPLPASSLEPSDDLVCTHQCREMVKSEFMVAFNSAEKQVVEYQAKVETLSNVLRKSEEERNNYQNYLQSVKQELEASKGQEHALQEQLLKEVNDSQERYQIQLKRCCELELERTRLRADNFEKETELLKDELKGLQQQLNEKSEMERKLSSFTAFSHETASESQTLVKHLQGELRNYDLSTGRRIGSGS